MSGEFKMSGQCFLTLSLLATGLLLSGVTPAQTYSKTETIAYHDNTSKWILGQTESVTCSVSVPTSQACNGDVVSATFFDPTYALPLTISAFGKLQQTLTFDTTSTVESGQRGTIKTVSDGRDTGTYNTTITFTSWKRGIPGRITYPIDGYQEAAINDHGWITSVTNEISAKTCYDYDPMGRLAKITYPSESLQDVCDTSAWAVTTSSFTPIASTEYGIPAGHWRQIVDTGNGRQVTYFDAMWRPLVEDRYDEGNVAPTRSVVTKRYDTAGRLAFQSYPRSSITSYADTTLTGVDTLYDALGRVTFVNQDSELGVLQTKTEYLAGFQTRTTNPNGHATTTGYQTWGQPVTDFPVSIDHPEGARTTIVRDAFGKPSSLRRHNGNNSLGVTRTYTYNGYQELCRTVEPETGATLLGYDAAGNLEWSASGLPTSTACSSTWNTATISPRRAVRSYDPRNRVEAIAFADGNADTTYSYTPDGLLESISALNGGTNTVTNTYEYNNRRLLTKESMLWNTLNWPISYSYNANGHLTSETQVNLPLSYAPNALGQPTKVGAYATGVSYFPNGALKQFTYGNGIVHTLAQNVRQLPDRSQDVYGSTKYLDDGYDYDGNANVAAISDGSTIVKPLRGDRTMTYDALDRLTKVVSPIYGTTGANYTYDVLDNLTRVNVGGANQRNHWYCYDARWHLTNVKTGSCTGSTVIGLGYEEPDGTTQGNVTNKNGDVYTFDLANRMRSFNPANSSTNTGYVYDGHGRRVRDTTSAARYSLYSQSGQLKFGQDNRARTQSWYLNLAGSLVAIRERNIDTAVVTYKYQHTDALGSPTVVTDANRNVVERNEYEPYGKTLDATEDEIAYTGHVTDAASGLVYAQQRYYDPMIGRFLSVDPVTADGATGANFNRYWYGNNNPYRFTDPDGRKPGDPFKTRQAAAIDALTFINGRSIAENVEYAGMIYQMPGDSRFYATTPDRGTGRKVVPKAPNCRCASVGRYHTHADYSLKRSHGAIRTSNPNRDEFNSEHFSPDDTETSRLTMAETGNADWRDYLATPSGKFLEYLPKTNEERPIPPSEESDDGTVAGAKDKTE